MVFPIRTIANQQVGVKPLQHPPLLLLSMHYTGIKSHYADIAVEVETVTIANGLVHTHLSNRLHHSYSLSMRIQRRATHIGTLSCPGYSDFIISVSFQIYRCLCSR
jgi:hypothetical protein